MKIALIPIDNRPVCYSLAKDIAHIDNNLELFLPEKCFLGDLKSTAKIEGILAWLNELEEMDAIIISLDTIAYGGLIPSRRSQDTVAEIKTRLNVLKTLLKKGKKIYAFTSIMRISNNNVNEEEKEYWNKYGKQIFEYSYNFHKEGIEIEGIPKDIITDYLATRQRNFEVNKMYLDWLESGVLDTLVYSKDDCAEYGLNVLEAGILKRMNIEKKLSALVKTGADEIPLTLLARAITDFHTSILDIEAPKIYPIFLAPEHKNLISNYEDISIENCTTSQLELAGCKVSDENDSDIILLVNNFEKKQGEIVMGVKTKTFNEKLDLPHQPFMVADVRFANGADNKFVEKLYNKGQKVDLVSQFYGYSAWNTSANTLGSLICAAAVKYFALKKTTYNADKFNKLQMIRFLDDWAYQANVRQYLKRLFIKPNVDRAKTFMFPFEKKLRATFKQDSKIKYYFPWKRFFEIGINIK